MTHVLTAEWQPMKQRNTTRMAPRLCKMRESCLPCSAASFSTRPRPGSGLERVTLRCARQKHLCCPSTSRGNSGIPDVAEAEADAETEVELDMQVEDEVDVSCSSSALERRLLLAGARGAGRVCLHPHNKRCRLDETPEGGVCL